MPARLARSSVSIAKPQNARKKSQKRTLDAFSIASHQIPQSHKIRQHRLGVSEGEEPRQKKRRLEDDDEDEDDEEYASNARRLQNKAVTKRTSGGVDGEADQGSDSEGNEWTMGGPIGDDSDSSLDSDEAFGESDEERFEGFTFRGSSSAKDSKKKQKKQKAKGGPSKNMDLDEDEMEEEEEDDFGDEGVDLATMLDDSDDEAPVKSKRKTQADSDEEPDVEDDEEDDDEEDDDEDEDNEDASDTSMSEAESEDVDADPTKLSKLQDLIASLQDDPPERRMGAREADIHESQHPSDFGLAASQKLKISDLLPTVTDPALRRSLKVLASDKPSKRSGIPGKLEAPLPKRQQDRIDRQAANQKAKETLDRWRDTVIHNRRAEHLQFPLKDPRANVQPGTNQMVAVQQSKPQTDLESAIQNILEESGLSSKNRDDEEKRIQEAEELQLNKIPVEEVMARRAELRKARELLFREEVKAKRIKKIKSKSYRRVHRREREREEAKAQEFLDPDNEGMGEDEKERQDRRRAEERMGAKHRESKWAKGMKKSGRTVWDDDARDGIIDMARRNEELRKRIEGKEVRDEEEDASDVSEDDEDDDEDSDFDDERGAGKQRLQKQLAKLTNGDDKESRLGNMQFMQRADAARKAQNNEDIERMRREIAGEDSPDEDKEDGSIGRKVFGPKPSTTAQPQPKIVRGELDEQPLSGEDGQELDDADIIVERPANKSGKTKQPQKPKTISKAAIAPKTNGNKADEIEDDDPWLTAATGTKKSKKHNDTTDYVPKPAVNGQLKPAAPKPAAQVPALKPSNSKIKDTTAPNTSGWITIPQPNTTNEPTSDSEEAQTNPILSPSAQQAAFHARAFASDDVATAFSTEKDLTTTAEDTQTTSSALPGWGSWTGDGLSKRERAFSAKKLHNPLYKTNVQGIKPADRKDAKLENVIISEAQQRKSKKYLASQLPHGFERREQYERSLRIPVGPEWTTKEVFQRNTKPRVVVKQGVVEAMEKPML